MRKRQLSDGAPGLVVSQDAVLCMLTPLGAFIKVIVSDVVVLDRLQTTRECREKVRALEMVEVAPWGKVTTVQFL